MHGIEHEHWIIIIRSMGKGKGIGLLDAIAYQVIYGLLCGTLNARLARSTMVLLV
jgi:hypothetical protein